MLASSQNYRGLRGRATRRKLSKECQADAEVEAPGGVEPPTNGLGNWGFPLHSSRVSNLRVGLSHSKWVKSRQSAVIWQRNWQHIVHGSARRYDSPAPRLFSGSACEKCACSAPTKRASRLDRSIAMFRGSAFDRSKPGPSFEALVARGL